MAAEPRRGFIENNKLAFTGTDFKICSSQQCFVYVIPKKTGRIDYKLGMDRAMTGFKVPLLTIEFASPDGTIAL